MVRTVLVTGASSGIGRATATHFFARGWHVLATARRPGSIEGPAHPRFERRALDVTDPVSIEAVVDSVRERGGALDVLVNNAGYALMGPLEAFDDATLARQLDVNVLGLARVTRTALPLLRAQPTSVVVNVSSIGGRIAFPFGSAYHATKFAVEGLSEALRFELAPHGVRVKLVEPGGIRTNFIRGGEWRHHPAYADRSQPFERLAQALDARLPGPETVAPVIYRAATDGTGRLRYTARPGPYLAMRRMLPDAAWRRLLTLALRRHAAPAALPADG